MGSKNNHRLAVVLAGGGARGAYEAGIIHYIRTKLPKEIALSQQFDLLCGSSVGAITTCFLASTAHDLKLQGQLIYKLWHDLKQDDIYRRNIVALSNLVGRSMLGIGKNVVGVGQKSGKGHFAGLIDTSPIQGLLNKIINWKRLHQNVQSKVIDAVSLTATNMNTGFMELFIDKHDGVKYTGAYPVHFTELHAEHARASAAIPIVFPTVKVGNAHYADGGLRLNTPLSPAVQLGADRLLVIGLHAIRPRALDHDHTDTNIRLKSQVDVENPGAPPKLGQIMGIVLNSLFLDRIDYDLEQMMRINRTIEWGELTYGRDFLERINQQLVKKNIRGDIANRGLKKLQAFSIFPSESISDIFGDCLAQPKLMQRYLGAFEKFVLRILDVDPAHGQNFLSYLMFVPEYIHRLLELGFNDAKAHHDQLIEFFTHVPKD